MVTWNDIERTALALPDVVEATQYGERAWKVRGKSVVWARPLRGADRDELGDRAPRADIACVWVAGPVQKQLLLEHEAPALFTTSHFDGYDAVLIDLERVDPALVEDLVVESWRLRAPKRLVAQFDARP